MTAHTILSSLRHRIVPDDLLDEDWLKLRDKMQLEDELWYFKTSPETWFGFPRCGLEGYALVRGDDELVDFVLLSLS